MLIRRVAHSILSLSVLRARFSTRWTFVLNVWSPYFVETFTPTDSTNCFATKIYLRKGLDFIDWCLTSYIWVRSSCFKANISFFFIFVMYFIPLRVTMFLWFVKFTVFHLKRLTFSAYLLFFFNTTFICNDFLVYRVSLCDRFFIIIEAALL